MRHSQDRWEELRQDWNREVEQAKQAGIHVIYTHRYQYLRGDLESMANDTYIGRDLSRRYTMRSINSARPRPRASTSRCIATRS